MDIPLDLPGERRMGRRPVADTPGRCPSGGLAGGLPDGLAGGLAARAVDTPCLVQLDWGGLMARLAAAHGARRILAGDAGPADTGSGSFAPGMADELARWRDEAGTRRIAPSPRVNLDTKADGKHPRIIGRIDAGEDRCRVRGLP